MLHKPSTPPTRSGIWKQTFPSRLQQIHQASSNQSPHSITHTQFKSSAWAARRPAWLLQCDAARTIRDVVEALIVLDNHLHGIYSQPPHVRTSTWHRNVFHTVAPQIRDAWRTRLRALHTYPTLTSAVNQYTYALASFLWWVSLPPHRQELRASIVTAQAAQAQRPAATPSPTHTSPLPRVASLGGVFPGHGDAWQGRAPADTQRGGLDQPLSGVGTRLHVAEEHTTALEARCALLDSLLQQHLHASQQDGVRAALQTQAQLCEMTAMLQHLSMRVDVLERRVASAVEEGEGRMESVLGALVHALQQQDVMTANAVQLAEVRLAVAELARKMETVEAVAGVGRVGSPHTPEGGSHGAQWVCIKACPGKRGAHRDAWAGGTAECCGAGAG